MKKYILSVSIILVSLSVYAQRDIKTLEGKSISEVITIMGKPLSKELGDEDFPEYDILSFRDTRLGIDRDTRGLDFFETTSNKYCVFSHLISGGIKVGDNIARLHSVDFAASAYGRNKACNGLKVVNTYDYQIFGHDANHVVYDSELCSVLFAIENNVVVAWAFITKEDIPYTPYDNPAPIW